MNAIHSFETLDLIEFNNDKMTENAFALICMPFYSVRWASIQLGLLKSVLKQHDIDCHDMYINLAFAQAIGIDVYEKLAQVSLSLIGEWLFSFSHMRL